MADARHDEQLDWLARLPRCALVLLDNRLWHDIISLSPDEYLRNVERQTSDGRHLGVALWHSSRRATKQLRHDIIAAAHRRHMRDVVAHVDRARKIHYSSNRQGIGLEQRAALRDLVPNRRPHREVSAGRVSEDDDPIEIERMLGRERSQGVDRASDIEIGPRPTAARLRQPAILDIPGGDALSLQDVAYRTELAQRRVLCLPASTVHEHHDGMWARARRHTELSELIGLIAVRHPAICCRDRQRLKFTDGHHRLIAPGQQGREEQGQKNQRGLHIDLRCPH